MALRHDGLETSHPVGGEQVEVLLVLDRPTGIGELAIDEHARTLLRRQSRVVITGIHYWPPYGCADTLAVVLRSIVSAV